MRSLIIALRDGFEDDTVVVRVSGHEVFNKSNVTTSLLKGYAGSLEVPLSTDEVSVEVNLPLRNISTRISSEDFSRFIEQKDPPTIYLGLSRRHGNIECAISDEPFRQL